MPESRSPEKTFEQARQHLQQGRETSALESMQQLCTADNRNPDHWMLLGIIQARSGQVADAEVSFRNVLTLSPDDANALTNLARALLVQGEAAQAGAILERAYSLHPGNLQVVKMLVDTFIEQQRYDDAADICRQAIASHPELAGPQTKLGNIRLMQGRYEEAVASYDRALELDPAAQNVHYNRGIASLRRGRPDEAISDLQAATRLTPDMKEAWQALGQACIAAARLPEAISAIERVIESDPADIDRMDLLAKLYRLVGRQADSQKMYHQILQQQPGHQRARFFLDAYQRQEQGSAPDRIPVDIALAMYQDENTGTRFDQSLTGSIDYQAPDALLSAILGTLDVPEQGFDILELGCGTGLVGAKLRDISHRMTGTDLSPSMLATAREKMIYDELLEGDLLDILDDNHDIADLVIAMDVLCFFGDLGEIFHKTAATLREHGVFGFSVVKADDDKAWHLNRFGHYAHSPQHLQAVAKAAGFEQLHLEEMVMRHEVNEEHRGYICLFRREAPQA